MVVTMVQLVAATLCLTWTPAVAVGHLRKTRMYSQSLGTSEEIKIRKPATDKRDYSYTTFDSGLRVLTVSDPDAEKAAFAVAVEAGSLEDPADFQGLAHFCEHMLFLGSEKYPDQEAFSKQLALHDGNHNAYTASDKTVYYNEIGEEGLELGLDIFAQFFIAPSFASNMVDKEIHAVDSEHMKYKPETQRRLWHLLWSIGNPENPSHQFATGDLETLKTQPEKAGKSLPEALKKYHAENYCVNRLHLVMVANKTHEEQLRLAHKSFDALPKASAIDCKAPPTYADKPQFSKELRNIGRLLTIPTPGAPEMWLLFPMPDLHQRYKAKAESYIYQAFGDYGPGGLKARLQSEDLSHSFSFSLESTRAGSAMLISFSLTQKGARNTEAVLQNLFAYLATVKAAGVNLDLVKSMKQLRQVQWDYQETDPSAFNFVSTMAGYSTQFEPADVLAGGSLIDEIDESLITQILNSLAPDNMNVALVTPEFEEKSINAHEPYYDFGYSNRVLEESLVARLKNAASEKFSPPADLKYVPRKLDLIEEGVGEDGPRQLVKQGRLELWWLGMGKAKLPKAIIHVKIGYSPKILSSVEGSVLAALHSQIVHTVLEKPSDPLQMCGLSYSVSPSSDGLGISFSGFDEHLGELVKLVLPAVRKPEYSPEIFEMLRRQWIIDVSDVTKMEPYQHAMEAFEIVTVSGHFSRHELLRTANDSSFINPAKHAEFLETLFADAGLTLLFAGNIGQDRAQEITKTFESLLHITRDQAAGGDQNGKLQVLDPSEEVEVRIRNPITGDPNSATFVTYQFGIPDMADRIHLSMLNSIINRPVFETLRTQHQLGYVVFGSVAPHRSIVEVQVIVQGFRENPDTVEALIESTVQNLTEHIAKLDHSEFETRKHSLDVELNKKDLTLGAFASRHWGQIWEGTHCFNKKELMLKYLHSDQFNSSAPLLEAWKRAVATGKNRKKVTVKLFGHAQDGKPDQTLVAQDTVGKTVLTLTDSTSVKSKLGEQSKWSDKYVCK